MRAILVEFSVPCVWKEGSNLNNLNANLACKHVFCTFPPNNQLPQNIQYRTNYNQCIIMLSLVQHFSQECCSTWLYTSSQVTLYQD